MTDSEKNKFENDIVGDAESGAEDENKIENSELLFGETDFSESGESVDETDSDIPEDLEIYGVQSKSFYDGVPTEELSSSLKFEDIFSGSGAVDIPPPPVVLPEDTLLGMTGDAPVGVPKQDSTLPPPPLFNAPPEAFPPVDDFSYGQSSSSQGAANGDGENFKLKIISSNTVSEQAPLPEAYEDISSDKKTAKTEKKTTKKKKKKKSFAQRNFPQKGDSAIEVIRKLIFLFAIVTLAGCICYFANLYVIQPYIEKKHEDELNSMRDNDSDWDDISQLYPGVSFPEEMKLSMAQAYAKNNDFVGWLDVQGMMISTPVVQTNGDDFSSPYLKKSFYGSYSKYGCPFLGSECGVEELSRNTVIYGHNMEYDDLVFGMLEKYRTIDGYEAAPQIKFETLYKTYLFDIYAVMVVNAKSDSSRYLNYVFEECDDEYFAKYIKKLDERKLYSTGVELHKSDKIITLSTCTYDYDNARLVVVGKLSAVSK